MELASLLLLWFGSSLPSLSVKSPGDIVYLSGKDGDKRIILLTSHGISKYPAVFTVGQADLVASRKFQEILLAEDLGKLEVVHVGNRELPELVDLPALIRGKNPAAEFQKLAKAIESGCYAIQIGPRPSCIMICTQDDPCIASLDLRSGVAKIEYSRSQLARGIGLNPNSLDWHGEPGYSLGFVISSKGRIAISLPGPPVGSHMQRRPVTWLLEPGSKRMSKIGEGRPSFWIGDKRVGVISLSNSLTVYDLDKGQRKTIADVFAAGYDGLNIWTLPANSLRKGKRLDVDDNKFRGWLEYQSNFIVLTDPNGGMSRNRKLPRGLEIRYWLGQFGIANY